MSFRLTIDRSTWRCGGYGPHAHFPGDPTALLNIEGHMCCLGFRARAEGVPSYRLLNVVGPHVIPNLTRGTLPALINWNPIRPYRRTTDFAERAMDINDDEIITREEREVALIALAADHGETWEFVGAYTHD